jgi:hypothetical protein
MNLREDLETKLRIYEKAHAKWMDTRVHAPEAARITEEKDQARKEYDEAYKVWDDSDRAARRHARK